MIDNETYRLRIGIFRGKRSDKKRLKSHKYTSSAYSYIHNYNTSNNPGNYFDDFIYIIFMYYILGIACYGICV